MMKSSQIWEALAANSRTRKCCHKHRFVASKPKEYKQSKLSPRPEQVHRKQNIMQSQETNFLAVNMDAINEKLREVFFEDDPQKEGDQKPVPMPPQKREINSRRNAVASIGGFHGSLNMFLHKGSKTINSGEGSGDEEDNFSTDAKSLFQLTKKHRKKKIKNAWKHAKKLKKVNMLSWKSSRQSGGGMTLKTAFVSQRKRRLPSFDERKRLKNNLLYPGGLKRGKRKTHYARGALKRGSFVIKGLVEMGHEEHNTKSRMMRRRGNVIQAAPKKVQLYGKGEQGHAKQLFFTKLRNHQFADHRAVTPMSSYIHACEEVGILPNPYYINHNNEQDSITLKYLNVGDERLKAISQSINAQRKAKSLDVSDNSLSSEGAKELLKNLPSRIESLTLADNQIRFPGAQRLKSILMSPDHKNLRYLNINNCGLDDHASLVVISALIHSHNVRELYMANNGIEKQCVFALASLLHSGKHCKIQKLDIHDNHLTALDFAHLFKSLLSNESLSDFNGGGNALGSSSEEDIDTAMDALNQVFSNNPTLTHLDLSGNQLLYQHVLMCRPGLMKNTSLLGFHNGHNKVRIDSKGYFAPLVGDDEKFERLDGHIHTAIKRRGERDCCQCCGEYVQVLITFDCRLLQHAFQDEAMYIYIATTKWNERENHNPYKMEKFGNVYGYKTNLPEGEITFFFSCKGEFLTNLLYERVKLPKPEELYMSDDGIFYPKWMIEKKLNLSNQSSMISVSHVNTTTISKSLEPKTPMLLRQQVDSVIDHQNFEKNKEQKVIKSYQDYHKHSHVCFEDSMFYNKKSIHTYHTKYVLACSHDWAELSGSIRKISETIKTDKKEIVELEARLKTEFFCYFGLTDRLFRRYAGGERLKGEGWVKFLHEFNLNDVFRKKRLNKIRKKTMLRVSNPPKSKNSMVTSVTNERVRQSGRTRHHAQTQLDPKSVIQTLLKDSAKINGQQTDPILKKCFQKACEESLAMGDVDIDFDDPDFKKGSKIHRLHFYLALVYLSRQISFKRFSPAKQLKELFDRYLISPKSHNHLLHDTFAVEMLFTKQTEHVFKDYEFALKKLYHYFVKQFHLTQLQYIKCVQLLFGPKRVDKSSIKLSYTMSHPFPTHANAETGIHYNEFLEALSRFLMNYHIDDTTMAYMLKVNMPFDLGLSRLDYRRGKKKRNIMMPLAERLLVVFCACFGRVFRAHDIDDQISEEDYFSSDSESSSDSSFDGDNKRLHSQSLKLHHKAVHHKHTHQLSVGTHACIEFKKTGKHVRKACTVSSINIDNTVDVILSVGKRGKANMKMKRKVLRNICKKRIYGRRHPGFLCQVQKRGMKLSLDGEIINANADGTYDVELSSDGRVLVDVLEENIQKRDHLHDFSGITDKQKNILKRFINHIVHRLHESHKKNLNNVLSEKILLLSSSAGHGGLSVKNSVMMINEIQMFLKKHGNRSHHPNISTEMLRVQEKQIRNAMIKRACELIEMASQPKNSAPHDLLKKYF